eukprot:1893205-Rhodomonas_salina.2
MQGPCQVLKLIRSLSYYKHTYLLEQSWANPSSLVDKFNRSYDRGGQPKRAGLYVIKSELSIVCHLGIESLRTPDGSLMEKYQTESGYLLQSPWLLLSCRAQVRLGPDLGLPVSDCPSHLSDD